MKMVCIRECYGLQGRHWKKGEVAEVDKACKDKSVKHFEPVGTSELLKPKPVSPAYDKKPVGSKPAKAEDK